MKHHLLAGAGLSALILALAPLAHAAEADTVSTDVEAVVIYGEGQSRQVQTVRAEQLSDAVAGVSPLKVVDMLPGVTFQSSDPFGAYEWSTRISIRGFNQNQLGFTLDGVPLGDMSYGNYNGLHISRAIATEDVGKVELSQGAGALSAASTSNLGGTLQFFSRDPAETFGGQANLTVGSNNMHRAFLRLESGSLDSLGGLRAYASITDQTTDKWKGGGEQRQSQYDFKAVLPIGPASLTAFYNRSERREQDYQDMSFEMIGRLGRDWDNTQPNWALAVAAAQAYNTGNPLPAPFATIDDADYAGAGVRDDDLYGATLDVPMSETANLTATVYRHTDKGQGLWWTPYVPSPTWGAPGSTAAPLSIRTTEYDIDRSGMILGLAAEFGDHLISAGLWSENNDFNQARRYYAETAAAPSRDPLGFQANPFFTQWAYAFKTDTTVAYVQDVWTVTDALKVNFGFKALKVENEVATLAVSDPTRTMAGKLESQDSFLPQIGVVYDLNGDMQLFAGYTENVGAFVSAATSGPFAAQRQSVVDYVAANLDPESSKTIEGGLRFRGDRFKGVIAAYHVTFDDRLLAASTAAPILGLPPVLSNVGSVETSGIEFAGDLQVTDAFSIYAAYSYNSSEYQDDVVSSLGVVEMATAGKTVVNTPKNLLKVEFAYEQGGFFGRLGVSYTGERYYTYKNAGGQVDASTVADLSLGYRFEGGAFLDGLELQANVTNLMDEDYISTIGSGGFAKSDPTGTAQTILPGAPRQFFVSVKKAF